MHEYEVALKAAGCDLEPLAYVKKYGPQALSLREGG